MVELLILTELKGAYKPPFFMELVKGKALASYARALIYKIYLWTCYSQQLSIDFTLHQGDSSQLGEFP